jgi:hypothetical protein
MNSGCFQPGDGRRRGKRPARLTEWILSRKGHFSYHHWPASENGVESMLRQLWLSGKLRKVRPGVMGCHGKPALYEVATS